ncbi:MAG TPA: Gfo/Idh/MocA family oxidoreductase [Mobilitalea sp.]|nr:Gfo/Idh/MocA family oxidoreductase [Mobilitalea sp.]
MKICFIGLGSIGTRHLRNISRILDQRKIAYIIDAFRTGSTELSDDLTALLHEEYRAIDQLPKDYDIIFITNPTSLHFETIQSVMDKTRHLFIEKPIFESCNYQIDNLSRKEEGIYYVACPLRYSPVIKYIKDFICNEKVLSVRAISSSYLPEWRKGVDYRNVYSAKKALGGGVSLDLIHEWDYLTYLFGMPEKIYNLNGHFSELEIDCDDISVYIAKYKDKLAEVHLDYIGRKTTRKLELYCKDTVISADLIANRIEFSGACEKGVVLEKEDIYLNEMNHFLDIISGKAGNSNDIKHAYQVLELAIANKY